MPSYRTEHNVKIRHDRLEVKELAERHRGLEQWRPVLQQPFPLSGDFLQETLFPRLGIAAVKFQRTEYSLEELLEHIRRNCPTLFVVHVFKRRFRTTVDHCLAELDELLVNGAGIESLAVESTSEEQVLQMIRRIGVEQYENLSYPAAIRRVLGLESWPETVWWR